MRLGESLKRLVPSMDRYHKVICPTLSLCLTGFAVYVAYQVFGVQRIAAERNAEQQQAAAERSKSEIDYRIQRMDDLNKQLTAQSKELTDLKRRLEQQSTETTIQEKRHEELVKLSENRAALLSLTAELQQHMVQVMMDQSRNEARGRSVLFRSISQFHCNARNAPVKITDLHTRGARTNKCNSSNRNGPAGITNGSGNKSGRG